MYKRQGKTTLALFFKFFKDSVCNGIPIEATQMFCKNRQENKERESSFEIQITVGDKFYAYGFSAVLSRRKVTGEWLYELYQNGSAKCLFEREGSKRPVLNAVSYTHLDVYKRQRYHCTDICDGESQGTDGINYSLASREMIANMIEIHANATPFDAGVYLSSCDKGVPGNLIGLARVDIPSVFVPGGTMNAGPEMLTLEQLGMYLSLIHISGSVTVKVLNSY